MANTTDENIALGHRLIVLKRSQNGRTLKETDRLVWVIQDQGAKQPIPNPDYPKDAKWTLISAEQNWETRRFEHVVLKIKMTPSWTCPLHPPVQEEFWLS